MASKGRGNGKSAGKSAKRSLGFSEKQLAKKFKHAQDFGVKGTYNKENVEKFKSAVEKSMFLTLRRCQSREYIEE
ncbi:MAG: hypothetical protein ONB46_25640 [candidate division KSB1 bacterium]|nr:hypothetical protein [candidate division KSB1 bacterium]MDZ7369323.1 hypothetical protein [candidate division KSB1 bacterium]MDZ7407331.1 hypothetical protein [candidate division KSB1 bacterium]